MRQSRAIMADLAASGMTPDQIALVMELSAAVSAEARPVEDQSAARRRQRDREYQAEKRAAERRQTSADSDDPSLSPSPNENKSNPHPHTHPDNNTRARGSRKNDRPAKPAGVDDQTWVDFLAHRKRKKSDVTPTAIAGIEREAGKAGWSMERALSEIVTRGWVGLNAEWITDRPPKASNDGGSYADQILSKQKRTKP